MIKCHACGKENCPNQDDPLGGPFFLHNRAAYAASPAVRERAACAWCGRAIALAEHPMLVGEEWFCSRECDEACDQ